MGLFGHNRVGLAADIERKLSQSLLMAKSGSWRMVRLDRPAFTLLIVGLVIASCGPSQEPYLQGDEFTDCNNCPTMVVVPAGSFVMGSTPEVDPYFPEEGPQREVTIQSSFAVGKTEVTWTQWEACVLDGGCDGAGPERADLEFDWGKGTRPVINVDWSDAKSYAEWLSRKTGKDYRLLSEAEWEYAARAGTATLYWFGDAISKDQARFDSLSTSPVASYPANDFGLYDMHGNVWEWVEDCSNRTYTGAPVDGTAWVSGDCNFRVNRGGSWLNKSWLLRSANRNWNSTTNHTYGFRVATTLD